MRETIGLGGGGAMYCPSVSPNDPNLMFVQCDMGGLYRSVNGGTTWTMVDGREMTAALNPMRCPVAFDPRSGQTRAYAYGAYRGIRRSDDGGATWPNIIVSDAAGNLGVTALGVSPATGDLILYGTENGVFQMNGTQVLNGAVARFFVDPTAAATVYVGIRGVVPGLAGGGVFRSTNSGQTWTPLPALPTWARLLDFGAGRDPNTGIVICYATLETSSVGGAIQGGVYRCSDPVSGAWAPVMGPDINTQGATPDTAPPRQPPARYDWLGVAANNPAHVLVSVWGTHSESGFSQGGQFLHTGVFRTTNSGATWTHIMFPINQNVLQQPSPAQRNLDGGWFDWEVGFGSGGPALIRDSDLGHAGGFAISPADANVALFTNKDALYVTRNALAAAPTWQALYTEAAGTRAKLQPWRSNGLEVTTTWDYDIDPNTPTVHYLCYTDIGFARSTDGGETWRHSPPRNRKPPASPRAYNTVYKVVADRSQNGRVFAACSDQHDIPYEDWLRLRFGGGVARSDDHGATWIDITGNLPLTALTGTPPHPVTSLALDQTSKRLWAAVFDSGVWSSDNAATLATPAPPGTFVNATWTDRSAGLPSTNRNTFRLYLAPNGDLYCGITGKKPASGNYVPETGLWLLSAGATQWRRLTPVPGNTASPTNMWWLLDYGVHPTDANIVYVCTGYVRPGAGGTGIAGLAVEGGVFRTTNASSASPAWTPVLLLEPAPGGPVPPDRVLPRRYRDFVQAFSAVFDPRDPSGNVLYATTRTHGIWRTRNGGDPAALPVWEEYRAVPFLSAHWLAFDGSQANRSSVFITTFGGGAWDPVDVYLRDFVADNGNPHMSMDITQSPDIILRQTAVANPQQAFGAGSGTENNQTLSDQAEQGQTNYLYVRVLNRGPRIASNVRATVYWSEPASLVTPSMWNLIGSAVIPTVPNGNVLTVSAAIPWTTVPAPGHYCFVALLDAATDHQPDQTPLGTWDNYIALIRRENNIAWRNFEVVNLVAPFAPIPEGERMPPVELLFVSPGADDRDTQMELEVAPRLPDGASIDIEIPESMAQRMERAAGDETSSASRGNRKIKLKPRGRQKLGKTRFPRKSRDRVKILVEMPRDWDRPYYDVVVRQLYREVTVGSITFRLQLGRRGRNEAPARAS